MFNKAIVKKPCRNLVKGLTSADLGKPDYHLALMQHQKYIEALTECGLEVTFWKLMKIILILLSLRILPY